MLGKYNCGELKIRAAAIDFPIAVARGFWLARSAELFGALALRVVIFRRRIALFLVFWVHEFYIVRLWKMSPPDRWR
jgi:hypothetical protein